MSKMERGWLQSRSLATDVFERSNTKLDVDQAAVVLIRQFGEDSAAVAYSRAYCCKCRGDLDAAREWNTVVKRIVDLMFSPREGSLH
jgi:hypothetical protein